MSAPSEALKRTRRAHAYTYVHQCSSVHSVSVIRGCLVLRKRERERFIVPSCPRQSVRDARNDARECRCETGTRGNMCGLLHSASRGGMEKRNGGARRESTQGMLVGMTPLPVEERELGRSGELARTRGLRRRVETAHSRRTRLAAAPVRASRIPAAPSIIIST